MHDTPLRTAPTRGSEGEKGAPGEKGFLQRTKEGKSRYYADALLLRAECLLETGMTMVQARLVTSEDELGPHSRRHVLLDGHPRSEEGCGARRGGDRARALHAGLDRVDVLVRLDVGLGVG